MCEARSQLDDWNTVQEHLRHSNIRPSVLIGNGASICFHEGYRYASLYHIAADASLTPTALAAFSSLRTKNFEQVLSALLQAKAVVGTMPRTSAIVTALDDAYLNIRDSLIRAVHQTHMRFSDICQNQIRQRICDELQNYRSVFSTNYDLLVYWSIMENSNLFKDFMWNPSPSGGDTYFDMTNTAVRPRPPTTTVHYLHGGLHLYRDLNGTTRKSVAGDDSSILASFGGANDAVPLFVSEGTSEDKLRSITHNDYLSFCYHRLSTAAEPLAIFGHSLGDTDAHLAKAIEQSLRDHRTKTVAFAIHEPDFETQDQMLQEKLRICQMLGVQLNSGRVRFFRSASHPLSQIAASREQSH